MTDNLDLGAIEARLAFVNRPGFRPRPGSAAMTQLLVSDVPALVARVRQFEALLDGWKVDMQHATVHYADWPEPARRLWDRWAEEMGRTGRGLHGPPVHTTEPDPQGYARGRFPTTLTEARAEIERMTRGIEAVLVDELWADIDLRELRAAIYGETTT